MEDTSSRSVDILGRRLAKQFVERVVVGLIVKGYLDLNETLQIIRRRAMLAFEEARPKAALATHLSMSERWVHAEIQKAREAEEASSDGSKAAEGVEPGHGYQLMLRLLTPFGEAYPEPLTIRQLRSRLKLGVDELDEKELLKQLRLYAGLGLLRPHGRGKRTTRFVAERRLLVTESTRDRLEKLSEFLTWLFPLALAHLEEEGEFGGVVAELHPEALAKVIPRIKKAVFEIINEAVAETQKSDDPITNNVEVHAVVAIGKTGGSDGGRKGRFRDY